MKARRLAVAVGSGTVLVYAPTVALAYAGAWIGDTTCTDTSDAIIDFSCLDNVLVAAAIGALSGLALGLTAAIWTIRRLRRRWHTSDPV